MKHSPLMRPRLVSTSILLILIAGMVYSVRPTVTAQANPQNIPDEDVPDEKETATSKGGIVEENDLIDSSKLQSVTGHVVKYQSLEHLFSPVMTPESGKRFTKFGKSASSNYVDVVEEPNSPEGFIYKQSSDRIQFGKMLQNRTAAQFTLKGEGNYKTGGGGGGGGKPPHWSADVERGTSKKLKIVQTIDSYYANVGSDLPLVFEILPSEPDIKKSDVSKVQVQFLIEGKTYTFPISSLKLVEGDQVWEGRNNERERNIFTIAVDEKRFDHLSVNRGSITKKAKIRVSARVDKNRVMSEKKRLERFGDDFIPVYELGVEDSNRNEKYDIRDQLQNTKDAELDTAVFSSNSGRRFSSLNFFEFSPLFNQRKGSSTNYELFIKFDTDESFPYNGHKLRVSAVDERRQGYALIYYGRKKLRDKNGNVVAEVVDKNNYRGQIKVDAFSDVDENRYFEYSWEGIDSTSSFLGEAMFSANVVATALSVAGTVNLWNPAGWASLTAAQTLKIATTLVGVVSLASSDMPSSGEWVKVTTYGAMVIRDKNGEKVLELMEPSDDVKQIEELITFSETGSGADNAETGSDTNNWNLSTQDTTFSVKVGDMLNVYTSGSIQAGSPTGTAIPFAPTGYAVEATLNFDVSEDPTIRVFE